MRDKERIDHVIFYLKAIWRRQPDTRFNQLIHNLQWEFNKLNDETYSKEVYEKEEHGFTTAYQKQFITDLFYVEDDKFLEFLKAKTKELKSKEE